MKLRHQLCSIGCLIFAVVRGDFDPSIKLKSCLKSGDISECSRNVIEDFRPIMETGIPELNLPPLDPLSIDEINFKFFDAHIDFSDVVFRGFKNNAIKSNTIDKDKRTWKVVMELPKFFASGQYALYGTIPPNLNLDKSSGDGKLTGAKVLLTIDMNLGVRDGGKMEVKDFDLNIKLEDIKAELECLFPKNGRCCPRKFLKSCNEILAKTVLRFVNRDGKNFIKNFQPQITKNLAPILQNYLNTATRNIDASDVINL